MASFGQTFSQMPQPRQKSVRLATCLMTGRTRWIFFGSGTGFSDTVRDWPRTATLMDLKEQDATQLPHIVQRSG